MLDMKTRTLMFTALLVGCLAGTAQATTTAAKDAPYEVVSYADLDVLLHRVRAAAFRVCLRVRPAIWVDFHSPVQECAKAATSRAMADVKSNSVTAAVVRL
jgi:hypothetical protein